MQEIKPSGKSAATKRPPRGDLAPDRIAAILKGLDEAYPIAECALTHRSPWELLVATILSAQCTDVRVNMVTPELFRRFPTPQKMAKATLPQLEALIRTTGFFRNKAKSIQGAARKIVVGFRWSSPAKTSGANHHPRRGAQDGQCGSRRRLRQGRRRGGGHARLPHRAAAGTSQSETPEKVEQELMRIIPPDRWIDFSHQIIHHGRQVCDARKPKCDRCNLEQLCTSKDKTWRNSFFAACCI